MAVNNCFNEATLRKDLRVGGERPNKGLVAAFNRYLDNLAVSIDFRGPQCRGQRRLNLGIRGR